MPIIFCKKKRNPFSHRKKPPFAAKEKPGLLAGSSFTHLSSRSLDDVRRLRATGPLDDLELHVLPLVQGLKALVLNGREMDEHVAAILSLNEAVPFFLR